MADALRQRTCIGCRRVGDKRSMLRLRRSPEGEVLVDVSGNMPGRGAYVCSTDCLERAIERNLIGRSLRTRFSGGFEDATRAEIDSFFAEMDIGSCKE